MIARYPGSLLWLLLQASQVIKHLRQEDVQDVEPMPVEICARGSRPHQGKLLRSQERSENDSLVSCCPESGHQCCCIGRAGCSEHEGSDAQLIKHALPAQLLY